jgi:hypothetical protein
MNPDRWYHDSVTFTGIWISIAIFLLGLIMNISSLVRREKYWVLASICLIPYGLVSLRSVFVICLSIYYELHPHR